MYGALLAACGWALATVPVTPGLVTALAGTAAGVATTALAAAPTHARLTRHGPRPDLLRRLVRADAARTAAALLALAGAVGAVR
ncbi:hypothetical protein [Kineococcus sp. SYSU DK001]|uniref:hypothetical protein n=1 Tax=Kineococcus sp. SYSU DK001 TaxID=3383122 RepID=UPI003D7EA0E3